MADCDTNCSVVLPLNQDPQDYAIQTAKQMEQHRIQDQELPEVFPKMLNDELENWAFKTEVTEKGIWLHSQYDGQDSLCCVKCVEHSDVVELTICLP